MRIVAIGDPHGDLSKVKKIPLKNADLILLTGDLGSVNIARKMAFENIERERKGLPEKEYSPAQKKAGFMEPYNSTMELVKYLSKFAPIYTISGNVESPNYHTRKISKELGIKLPFLFNDLNAMKNVRVINNKIANFNGIRIGGLEYFMDTNWVQDFKPSDYKRKMIKAKKQTEKAKKILKWFNNVDILVCHQPPYGVLDKVGWKLAPKDWLGKHAGSKAILNYIKKKQPKYVFCGHIHEAKGMKKIGKTEVYNLGVAGYKAIEFKNP
ncbi:MAG: metallophosphoesterase [Candidatus Woesearchaeota archaeon]